MDKSIEHKKPLQPNDKASRSNLDFFLTTSSLGKQPTSATLRRTQNASKPYSRPETKVSQKSKAPKEREVTRPDASKQRLSDPCVSTSNGASMDAVIEISSSPLSATIESPLDDMEDDCTPLPKLRSAEGSSSSSKGVATSAQKLSSRAPSTSALATSSAANKKVNLFDLKNPANPITHSVAYKGAQHINSCTTGHQRSGGTGNYFHQPRNEKLKVQDLDKRKNGLAEEGLTNDKKGNLLRGTRIYVNGYTRGITRSEIVRLVAMHGGTNLITANNATHVITSMDLSAAKRQKHFTTNPSNKYHVVEPEWLLASIEAGRRMKEWDYRVVAEDAEPAVSWS